MDEASRRKLRALRIVFGVPTVLCLAIAAKGIVVDYREIRLGERREETRTAVTEGAFVEVHRLVSARSGTSTPQGTVVFTPPSGEPIKFTYTGEDAKLGRKVEIRYDPADPRNFRPASAAMFGFADLVWDNAFFTVVGAVFLFALLRVPALVDDSS